MYWWVKVESTDLVHYQQITPYAMTGADDNISYFTGSAVVDKNKMCIRDRITGVSLVMHSLKLNRLRTWC